MEARPGVPVDIPAGYHHVQSNRQSKLMENAVKDTHDCSLGDHQIYHQGDSSIRVCIVHCPGSISEHSNCHRLSWPAERRRQVRRKG